MILTVRKKKEDRLISNEERASSLITVQAYDKDDDIFLCDDKSLSACYMCTPLTGCDEQLQERINGFLNSEFPSNFVLQFCLFRSPDILRQKQAMMRIREDYRKKEPFAYQVMCERVKFLEEHTHKNLISNSRKGFYDSGIVMDLKLVISAKMRIGSIQPDPNDSVKFKQILTRVEAGMNSCGLNARRMNVKEYIRFMQTIINWNDPVWEREDQYSQNWEPDKPVCEQIFDPNEVLTVSKRDIQIGDKMFIKTLSAKKLPEQQYCGDAITYVGDLLGGNSSLKQNYMVCVNLFFPSIQKTKDAIERKRQFTVNQAQGSITKFVPVLKDKENDFQVMYDSLIKGDKPVRLSYTVVLFSKSQEESDYAAMTIRNVWREKRFELMEDDCIMLPMLINCLPMCADAKAINTLFRYKTLTTPMAATLIPIFGEWKGTGTYHATLLSRNGQIMSLSLHDSDTNKNAVIAAESGSGKSFLINEIIFSYLSEGAQIWVIDAGKSYQKLNELLQGDFLQFDESANICLNPFELISDYTDDEDAVVQLVANMASQSNRLTELQISALKQIIGELWKVHGNSLMIDHIAQACLNEEDERVKDVGKQLFAFTSQGSYGKYFNGRNTINFKNKFTVLELDELAGRKHLRQVILLQLIYQIQNEVYLGERNRKKIVIVDEAWDLLKEGAVAKFMEHAYRKFRKYGGSVIIATQSINDLYNSETGQAIAENSASMYLLGQTEETIESVKESKRLAVPDFYYRLLKTVHTIAGVYSEIFIKSKAGIGVGRLIVGEFQKLLYSTTPEDVQAIQNYLNQGLTIDQAINAVLRDRGLLSSGGDSGEAA